jgi:hypothetical protein
MPITMNSNFTKKLGAFNCGMDGAYKDEAWRSN